MSEQAVQLGGLFVGNVKDLTLILPALKTQITIRKDHKGHKDRGYFAEGNERWFRPGFGLVFDNNSFASLASVRILLSLCPL